MDKERLTAEPDPDHVVCGDAGRGIHLEKVGLAEKLRREPVGRAIVEALRGIEGEEPAVLCRGDEDESRDGGQPPLRVAREGRDPLEERIAAAESGHRPEVAGRVGGDVDLRRHRPLAPRVGDERVAHRLDRSLRRDGGADMFAGEERDHG